MLTAPLTLESVLESCVLVKALVTSSTLKGVVPWASPERTRPPLPSSST